ncbi:hypothetical protein B0H94_103172 [Salsuginibacillus halophilus]|uniref:YdbS-like PH domain-containing protein n=1 Tax=Salsuginibacillus halophilus TaxID=517424 RepID=A0A2P8HWF7_9BACI|nr:PH domain-containing protein [Salsuginibacillus halophilus]PSL50560.1 hypothetical protein B0H94_103172 [Salsuginibacillus halophilus]
MSTMMNNDHTGGAMRAAPKERISKKALPVWRFKGGLESLFFLAVPVGYYFLMNAFQYPLWLMYVLSAAWVLWAVSLTFIIPAVRWRRWRYEILEEEVDLQYGVIIVRRTLIPMSRVQHVDTEQGPIYRRYKLSAVTISTAATIHQIPALTEEVAAGIRDRISNLAETAEDDDTNEPR